MTNSNEQVFQMQKTQNKEKYIYLTINLFVILSACCFCILTYEATSRLQKYLSCVYMALFLGLSIFLVQKYIPSLIYTTLKKPKTLYLILSFWGTLFTIIYICLYTRISFFVSIINPVILILFSSPFIFVFLYFAYSFISKKIVQFYKSLTKLEKRLFIIFFITGIIFFALTNLPTGMFVGRSTNSYWFEIFSFDVSHCLRDQLFTNFSTSHNCVRHALITLFTFPIFIIPTCLFNILKLSILTAFLVLFVQLLIIFVMIILIKRLFRPDSVLFEIIFTSILFLSSSFLFNMLVYEKFVISAFFIILTIDASLKNNNEKYLYFLASVGTLTTSLFLLPIVFFNKNTPLKTTIKNISLAGLGFILLLILGGQINHIVFGYQELSSAVGAFGGASVNFINKIAQYLENFAIFFVMPNTIVASDNCLWYPKTSIFGWLTILGFVILVISIIGFIKNYKDKFCQICFYWLLFLTFCDLVIGWGTALNELFIYSITYSWCVFVLFFKGLQFISRKQSIMNAIAIGILVLMFSYNIYRLYKIVEFGYYSYPSIFRQIYCNIKKM